MVRNILEQKVQLTFALYEEMIFIINQQAKGLIIEGYVFQVEIHEWLVKIFAAIKLQLNVVSNFNNTYCTVPLNNINKASNVVYSAD